MVLYQETGKRKYLDAIPPALAYLKKSALPPADHFVQVRSRIPKGTPVLARFYELKTNRPLYITKGTRVSVLDRAAINVDGYEVSYDDKSVITHYGVLTGGGQLALLEAEYKRLAAAGPGTVRRSEELHGLSPWSDYPRAERKASGDRVKELIASLDSRGAWTEQGNIGKADRLVSLRAAKDMAVKIGTKTYALKEDEILDVFQGAQAPAEEIIRSETFAKNMAALMAWLKD
jgi:hypothetical protein